MIIRRFKKQDAEPASKMVKKLFLKFSAPHYKKSGINHFLNMITPEGLIKRSTERPTWVAVENNKIIGLVQPSPKRNWGPGLLHVDEKYHHRGIATKLMQKLESFARHKKVKVIYAMSSLYAIKFYEKLGFKKSRGIARKKGSIYQPMKKILTG